MLESPSIDISTIAEILAEAFADDPCFKLVFEPSSNRLSTIQAFFEPYIRDASQRGKIAISSDSLGTCVWYPAEVEIYNEQYERVFAEVVKIVTKFAGEESARRYQHLLEQLDNNEPQPNHCEVFFLGVKPSARGKGIGRDLIEPVLDYADKNQQPCYLVSSTPRNLSFYERHGFKKYSSIAITDTYSMTGLWRDFINN